MRGSYPENVRPRGPRSQGRDYEDLGRERDPWRDERRFEGDWNQYGSDRNYNQDYDEHEDRDRQWSQGHGYSPQRSRGEGYGGFGSARGRYQGQQGDRSERERWGGGRGYGSSLEGYGRYQRGSDSDEPGSQYGGGYGGQWRGAEQQQRRSQMPKGYTRSDERIREDVCERLAECQFDISNVSVDVKQGKVTLEGSVSERRTKHQIEDIADHCMGVKDVDNRLRVQREEASGRESESGSESGYSATRSRKEH